jgi:hypothetical protein
MFETQRKFRAENPCDIWNGDHAMTFRPGTTHPSARNLNSGRQSSVMADNPFADLSLERAIALRWVLRDIQGKRLKLMPVADSDLRALIELNLVVMRDGTPELTQAGKEVLD